MRKILPWLLVLFLCIGTVNAQLALTHGGKATPGGGGGGCTEATNFLARTSGLDGTHTTAYTTLICGLVTDGVFAKLDVLDITATQDSTTARLNLVQNAFNPTIVGSCTFTADRGYACGGNSSNYFNTNFNGSTAGGNYGGDGNHFCVWDNAAGNGDGQRLTESNNNGSGTSNIFPDFGGSPGTIAIRVNNAGGGVIVTNPNGFAKGFYCGDRTAHASISGYLDASLLQTLGDTSGGAENANFSVGASSVDQFSAWTTGGALTGTDITNLNSRIHTYMTAVGN